MNAVFGGRESFRIIDFYPKNNFRLIKRLTDVVGIKFDSVIVLGTRIFSKFESEAYQHLLIKQPDLFR